MGFWDALTGRRKPVAAKLDALFALPQASITLQTAANFTMTGRGGVCFRGTEGAAMAQTIDEVVALLDNDDDPDVERHTDRFGYTWLVAQQEQMSDLVTDLHAVNTSLEMQGFGPALLCSLVSFADPSGRALAIVYLYKQGTFYPFAPTGPQQRDNLLEVQARDLLKGEIPLETDMSRWMALWDAPAL